MALHNPISDLTRRISRKLEIRRGIRLTYEDLTLIIGSGAFATLQAATAKELEQQCQSHLENKPPGQPAPSPSRAWNMPEESTR